PAKITSSIPPPRIAVGRFSPITQRSASRRLDLPQPLGPTTPVSPSAITRSVGSTKLLNPVSLSLVNCKTDPVPLSASRNVPRGPARCQRLHAAMGGPRPLVTRQTAPYPGPSRLRASILPRSL